VHFTGPHLWHVPLLYWLKRQGIATIHTIHDLEPHTGTSQLLHLWNGAVLRGADEIVVHGQRYQAQLQAKGYEAVTYLPLLHLFLGYEAGLPVASGQWSVVSGQWSVDRQGQGADASRITHHPSPVLFFGRLEAYKGVGDLLTAWAMLPDEVRQAGRLILVGKGELPAGWADRLPPQTEVRNRLILDEEAAQLFADCSLLVLPYWDATQSALMAAAYYFGKPVIATRTGALPEYLVEGKTGWLVTPRQPGALADVLAKALSDPSRLQKMGVSGRQWYDEHRKQETSDLLSLYVRLSRDKA
jgi:glycosyltransferase involved in cell wall biosynthesis